MNWNKMSTNEGKAVFFILLVGIIFSLISWGRMTGKPSILDSIKQPEWFKTVTATEINNEAELDSLWQSKKRCCSEAEVVADNRAFYKSCADAISRNPNDENLAVKCLWLMPVADSGNKIDVYRLLLLRYADHKDSLRNCVNCNTGDTISRVTQDVAAYDAASGMPEKLESAITMLEEVLGRRGADTSAWVKLEIYTDLGEMYLRSGVTEQRKQRIGDAYREFDVIRMDESLSKRIGDFEKIMLKVNDSGGMVSAPTP